MSNRDVLRAVKLMLFLAYNGVYTYANDSSS